MPEAQVIQYADIGQVRMERKSDFQTRSAECNRLLKEGWVLLGVYPLTTLGDMTEKGSENKHREGQRPVPDGTGLRSLPSYSFGKETTLFFLDEDSS
jgi:hypothetical protein